MSAKDDGVPVFKIETIELVALRKLHLVSKVLATKLSGTAAIEQECLADCLAEVLDRYETYEIDVALQPLRATAETPPAGGE